MMAQKLIDLAAKRLKEYIEDDFFDYHNWDDLIECEGEITIEDLDDMKQNLEIKIEVSLK